MVGKEGERSLWNRVWPRGRKGAYGIKHTRPKTLAGWPCEVTSPSKLPQFRGHNKEHTHKNTVCCHIWSGLQFPFVYSVSSFPDGKMEMKINPNSKMAGGFPGGSVVKKLPASAGDSGSIPGSERFPGEANGNPLQYSCLGNPMDRGAWWATVNGVTKTQTWLSN